MRGIINENDILIFIGLVLVGYGLYLIWMPLVPLVIGALLFLVGIIGIWRKGSIK
jgi:hypothetical protein